MYKALETWKEKPDFKVHMCLFKKEKSTTIYNDINENVVFSIMFGKINIFHGSVMSVNDELSKDLIKVVKQVTPPNGKVAYLSKGNQKVLKIHGDEEKNIEVTYFVTKVELPRLQEKFLLQSVASRSRVKSKPPNTSIDDGLDESDIVSKQKSSNEVFDTDEEEFFAEDGDEDEGGDGYEETGDGSDDGDYEDADDADDDDADEEKNNSSISRQSSTSSNTH